MSSAPKMTRIVAKVPAAYRTATPRYWCNHCADSHDSKAIMGVHYQEWHPEHISEVASWDGWVKQTYDQTRHFGNESDWEGEEQGQEHVHDEGSDEEDMREESAKGMRVGPIPCNADPESDEEYRKAQRNRKPVTAMDQARHYFHLAAHGKPGNDVLELTRRATAKLKEADAEIEGEGMTSDGHYDDDDDENEPRTRSARGRGGRGGARGVRGGSRVQAQTNEEVHPVAKAAWNMSPYQG